MSSFTETMTANPARMVVTFGLDANGGEQYQWGIVGKLPVIGLIGAVSRIINSLVCNEWIPEVESDTKCFMVVYNIKEREWSYYLHPDVVANPGNRESLIGMLEMIKILLIMNGPASQRHQNKPILGVDGKPMW